MTTANDGNNRLVAIEVRFPGEWFLPSEFVTPCQLSVTELFREIVPSTMTEDEAMLRCWDWVVKNVTYPERVNGASEYHRYDAYQTKSSSGPKPAVSYVVTREFWDWPYEIIGVHRTKGYGVSDCQGTTCLLVSLLRNFLPAERVYAVVGNVNSSGHAWARVERRGMWFVLETTVGKVPAEPWRAEIELPQYNAKLLFNDFETHLLEPISDLLPVVSEEIQPHVTRCWGCGCRATCRA